MFLNDAQDAEEEDQGADWEKMSVRERKRVFGAYLQNEMKELTIDLQNCTTPEFGEDYLRHLTEGTPKPGAFIKYQGPWNYLIARMDNIAETMAKLRKDLQQQEDSPLKEQK